MVVFFNNTSDEFSDSGNEIREVFIYTKRVIKITQPWKIVRPVKCTQEVEPFSYHIPKLIKLFAILDRVISFTKHASHNIIQGGSLEVLSQGNDPVMCLFVCYVAQHGGAF